MAAYRRVYDSRHRQADCQEPGSAPEAYSRYGVPFLLKLLAASSPEPGVLRAFCSLLPPLRVMISVTATTRARVRSGER